MVTKIVSFGFRNGKPAVQDGDTLMNVGMFRNPYLRRALRPLTGLDPQVGAFIKDDPAFMTRYQNLQTVALTKGGVLYLGCIGGRHRSVYLADRLGKELEIPVEHRDIDVGGKGV